jgi:AraC family transcriptional regulator, activator of mtrCDE
MRVRVSEEVELEAGDARLLPTATVTCCGHIGGAPAAIATEFRNAIPRKTTAGTKADTGIVCGRLMFDAVVLGGLPHSAQSPV